MDVFERFSQALLPHREALQDTIYRELCGIKQLLEHGNRLSDLGKPDTDDTFLRIIRKQKFGTATNTGANLLGRPRLGEYWLIQAVTNNGVGIKSPAAVLRTNAGALVAVIGKEAITSTLINGTIALLPGEELQIEPEAEGEYDLTVFMVRRKIPQHIPNAYGGVGQGDDINLQAHTGEHEPDRYLPELPGSEWAGQDVPQSIIAGQQEGYGGLTPEVSEPVGLQPET